MEKKPYYLSIDPNTSGIAVVAMDENFDIVRKKGKQLAIFREIQETETAEKRRMQRTSRKNQKHRKERVKCLRELFGDCFDDSMPFFYWCFTDSGYRMGYQGSSY